MLVVTVKNCKKDFQANIKYQNEIRELIHTIFQLSEQNHKFHRGYLSRDNKHGNKRDSCFDHMVFKAQTGNFVAHPRYIARPLKFSIRALLHVGRAKSLYEYISHQ